MKTEDVITYSIATVMVALFIAFVLWLLIYLFVWLPATFEAQSFNKFSKIKATTWDAIWTDLKVTSQ